MRLTFVTAGLAMLSMVSCSKNDSNTPSSQQALEAHSWQQTNSSASASNSNSAQNQRPVATFNASQDFTLTLNSALGAAGGNNAAGATITGKWSYDGSNITISNASISYTVNGSTATNFQAVVNGYAGGLAAFNIALQAYCSLVQVDASGNLSFSGGSSGAVTWAVKQLSTTALSVTTSASTKADFIAQ
ncbi:MAG: hypothetical protein J7539_09910 [Niabella sp.]|nr:hypothetical protein [Niabella sp.]